MISPMERCERCGREHGLRFVCLGQRLCYTCATAVVRLTTRYPALHDIAAAELAEMVSAHAEGHAADGGPAAPPIRPR